MKKYELAKEYTKCIGDKILYRIRALVDIPRKNVRAGSLGGFVESEENLSHAGSCWIFDNAAVYEEATVIEHAEVCGLAQVYGRSRVAAHAHVGDNAEVNGQAFVAGNSYIAGFAHVGGWAITSGASCVFEHAEVVDSAFIYDEAEVYGRAKACGCVRLRGNVRVGGTFRTPEHAFLASGTLKNSDEVIAIDGLPDHRFPSMGYNAASGECWLGDTTIPAHELIDLIAQKKLPENFLSIYVNRAEELLRRAKELTKRSE